MGEVGVVGELGSAQRGAQKPAAEPPSSVFVGSQQRLYFMREPQGQGALRPTLERRARSR
jgi:hypothetical protein